MKTDTPHILILGVLVTALLTTGVFSADSRTCSVCGMIADEAAPFTAKIVDGKKIAYFCDIGDLLIYLKGATAGRSFAYVKDYQSGEWIGAAAAHYVKAPRRFTTPMGWSIAAFRDRRAAGEYGTAIDLETVLKDLK